jgi:hypothetical protein
MNSLSQKLINIIKKNIFTRYCYFKIKNFLILILIAINTYYFRNKIKKYSLIKSKFNSVTIDTTNYLSKLCFIGGKFGTDKSILNNKTASQHSYTAAYNILFGSQREKKLNIAEIGIFHNHSLEMFREYFVNSIIDGFEFDDKLIENAKKFNLPSVNYFKIDVTRPKEIIRAFKKSKKKYDIIIDDSTHEFDDQINIIYNTNSFLKKGGYLIIEDISRGIDENIYYEKLKKIKSKFQDITFIKCKHTYNFSILSLNHKLLVLRK